MSLRPSATHPAFPPRSPRSSASYPAFPPRLPRSSATHPTSPPRSPRSSASYPAFPPRSSASHSVFLLLALLLSLLVPSAKAAPVSTITVSTAADTFDVPGKTCINVQIADLPGADGAASLREAICAANNTPGGPHTIRFGIASGAQTILVSGSPLPDIAYPAVIDATTQPGYAGKPLITLDGSALGGAGSGLTVTGGNTTVRGLAVVRFPEHGIDVYSNGGDAIQNCHLGAAASGSSAPGNGGAGLRLGGPGDNAVSGNLVSGNRGDGIRVETWPHGNLLTGNKVGTDLNGALPLGNLGHGIHLLSPAGNTVGGSAAGAGNLVSANDGDGIHTSDGSPQNTLYGNKIGVNASGSAALPNQGRGVYLASFGNMLGGTEAGQGNLVSGNRYAGVYIANDSPANQVLGNTIGANAGGTGALGNCWLSGGVDPSAAVYIDDDSALVSGNLIAGNPCTGVYLDTHANDNRLENNRIGLTAGGQPLGNTGSGVFIHGAYGTLVGGEDAASANRIAYNAGDGVTVITSTLNTENQANAIRRNLLYANSGLGIDLGDDGPTPNDAGDPDLGPNLWQNYPLIGSLAQNGGSIIVSGALNSAASQPYTLRFFASPSCDPSGYGEGQAYLGSLAVTTDASGAAAFSGAFPLPPGGSLWVAATASDSLGSTSEFSPCRAAQMLIYLPVVMK